MANNVKVVISGQNDASKVFEQVESQLHRLESLAEAVGIAFSLHEIADMAESIMQMGAQLDRTAQKTGMTAEQLSALGYAAKLSGVDAQELNSALNQFTRQTLNAAETGTGKAALAFKALGINVRDASGQLKPVGQLLQEVAAKIATLPAGFMNTGTAAQLFGRQGANLVPVLNQVAGGFGALEKQAAGAGQLISTETAKQLHIAEEATIKLESRVQGLAVSFLGKLAPAMMPTLDLLDRETSKMNGQAAAAEQLGHAINLLVAESVTLVDAWQHESLAGEILGAQFELVGMKAANLAGAHYDTTAQEMHIANLQAQLHELGDEYDRVRKFITSGQWSQTPHPAPIAELPKPTGTIDLDALGKGKKSGGARGTTADRTKEIQDAVLREREAGAAAQITVAKALEQEQIALLDLEKEQGLVTLSDYYSKRGQMEQAAAEQELRALYDKEDALLAKRKSLPAGPSVERMNVDSQLEKVDAEIMARAIGLNEQQAKNAAEELKRQQELRDFVLSSEAEIRSAKGQTLQVAIEAIQREYDEKKRKLLAMGGSPQDAAGFDMVAQQKIAKVTAQNVAEEIDAIYAKLDLDLERLSNQVTHYAISAVDAERQANLLRSQAADAVEKLTTEYGKLAKAAGDPKMMAEADKMGLKLDEMRQRANHLRDAVGEGLTSGFQNFFQTLQNGGSAASAFESFAMSIVASIEKMIEQMLIMQMVQKMVGMLFPGASPGGGAGESTGGISSVAGPDSSGIIMLGGGGDLAANQPAIVGDKGPELWVPRSAGSIIPNSALQNSGGNTRPTANVQVTVVNNGSPKNAQATTPQWNEQLKMWHMQVHMEDLMDNGPLSRGMFGR